MVADSALNELQLRPQIHRDCSRIARPARSSTLNAWIYADVFHTPKTDAWLGLLPRTDFTGLPGDGCRCDAADGVYFGAMRSTRSWPRARRSSWRRRRGRRRGRDPARRVFGPALFAERQSRSATSRTRRPTPRSRTRSGSACASRGRSFRGSSPSSSSRSRRRTTNAVGGAAAANVFWLEPRLHLRFELMPGQPGPAVRRRRRRLADRAVVAHARRSTPASPARATSAAACASTPRKGFVLRFDARVSPACPGTRDATSTPEARRRLRHRAPARHSCSRTRSAGAASSSSTKRPTATATASPTTKDKCPDRAEDTDGFEDADGCPDIDNDLDRVLDIADKCADRARDLQRLRRRRRLPRHACRPRSTRCAARSRACIYAEGETARARLGAAEHPEDREAHARASVDQASC